MVRKIIFDYPVGGVVCDICGKDWTDDKETSGGFLLGTNLICPDCDKNNLRSLCKKYNEERFIKGYCPDKIPFIDWFHLVEYCSYDMEEVAIYLNAPANKLMLHAI